MYGTHNVRHYAVMISAPITALCGNALQRNDFHDTALCGYESNYCMNICGFSVTLSL